MQAREDFWLDSERRCVCARRTARELNTDWDNSGRSGAVGGATVHGWRRWRFSSSADSLGFTFVDGGVDSAGGARSVPMQTQFARANATVSDTGEFSLSRLDRRGFDRFPGAHLVQPPSVLGGRRRKTERVVASAPRTAAPRYAASQLLRLGLLIIRKDRYRSGPTVIITAPALYPTNNRRRIKPFVMKTQRYSQTLIDLLRDPL